jgi:hypothetical protein
LRRREIGLEPQTWTGSRAVNTIGTDIWEEELFLGEDLNLDELKRRLREGDYLEVSTGGGAFEVWAEPLGSPPSVYYEGERLPINELDRVAEKIVGEMRSGEIRCRWVADD